MKNIVISGGLGKDAATRQAGSDNVTSFSVAVEDRTGRDKKTIWFDCSLWGKRGEALAQYLTKGARVSVSGDLGTREHEGKTYLTVRVNDVTLLGGGERSSGGGSVDKPDSRGGFDLSDDIPFVTNQGIW